MSDDLRLAQEISDARDRIVAKHAALRDELIAELRQARIEVDRTKNAYASPYSSHDALVAYHRAWGFWMGLARAVEILDAQTEVAD